MNGKLNSQTVKIVFGWITTAVILRFYFVITSNFLKIKTISNSRSFLFFSSFSQLTDLVKRLAQDDLNLFHLLRYIWEGAWNGLVWSPCCPRDSQESSSTPHFKSINSLALSLVYRKYWTNEWRQIQSGMTAMNEKYRKSTDEGTRGLI